MKLQQYLDHIGSTPEQRARWLLDFCLCDFMNLERGQRSQLCQEWAIFVRGDRLLKTTGGYLVKPHPFEEDQTKHLWRKLDQMLEDLRDGEPWDFPMKGRRRYKIPPDGRLIVETILDPPFERDEPLLKAMEALESVANRFRFCANEACSHPFIRTKRQRYCSSRCRGTVIKRKYRQKRYRQKRKAQTSDSN